MLPLRECFGDIRIKQLTFTIEQLSSVASLAARCHSEPYSPLRHLVATCDSSGQMDFAIEIL